MGLFHDVAFLHDIDQCTIRGFMYTDSATVAKIVSPEFNNINEDKKHFAPVLNKQTFVENYRDFFEKETQRTDYNEVLANIFPESLLGIAISEKKYSSDERKFLAMVAKKKIKEDYQIDLPLFIYNEGQILDFNPTKEEIFHILMNTFNNQKKN